MYCCTKSTNPRSTGHHKYLHLDEGLHEVLLRNVIAAADHLLQHPRQHHL